MKNKTLITAHTGADNFPDNSPEFVRHAVSSEADAFEIDIRKRADGVLIIAHDPDVQDAPTLREVFEIARSNPQIQINCDLKNDGLELEVLDLVRAFGYEGRIVYSGTVASAMEGALCGVPGVAVSLCSHLDRDYETAARLGVKFTRALLRTSRSRSIRLAFAVLQLNTAPKIRGRYPPASRMGASAAVIRKAVATTRTRERMEIIT